MTSHGYNQIYVNITHETAVSIKVLSKFHILKNQEDQRNW